ncbi:hypothetical protein TRIP_E110059 [uncultured Spirochaetota bacterium]|uniref:Uncharacterized protein n=1 Tax=uncultured Spirochaetota bacterium TaxID=460511 RepID=A0A652ZS42_9SPIR|nr:hypothetical protein TRIP_E110059 [uncultured Spirochaetota bacterium]
MMMTINSPVDQFRFEGLRDLPFRKIRGWNRIRMPHQHHAAQVFVSASQYTNSVGSIGKTGIFLPDNLKTHFRHLLKKEFRYFPFLPRNARNRHHVHSKFDGFFLVNESKQFFHCHLLPPSIISISIKWILHLTSA